MLHIVKFKIRKMQKNCGRIIMLCECRRSKLKNRKNPSLITEDHSAKVSCAGDMLAVDFIEILLVTMSRYV